MFPLFAWGNDFFLPNILRDRKKNISINIHRLEFYFYDSYVCILLSISRYILKTSNYKHMKEKTSIVKDAYSILCELRGFMKKGQWTSEDISIIIMYYQVKLLRYSLEG